MFVHALKKQNRPESKKTTQSSVKKSPLAKVYSNVVDPFESTSYGGSKYSVSLLKKYSSHLTVSFVKCKSKPEDCIVDITNALKKRTRQENAFNNLYKA